MIPASFSSACRSSRWTYTEGRPVTIEFGYLVLEHELVPEGVAHQFGDGAMVLVGVAAPQAQHQVGIDLPA